jgi:hypothetical protein
VCKDFGLKVCFGQMCGYENKMNNSGHGKIKCNNHEIKEVKSFKYLKVKQ